MVYKTMPQPAITMKEHQTYVGFPPLADREQIVDALVNDPPDVRWRVVRDLFRIENDEDRKALIQMLQPFVKSVSDFRVSYRIYLALRALHTPQPQDDYFLVRGKGAFRRTGPGLSIDPAMLEESFKADPFPVIDFHIHPKLPDLQFFSDLLDAGVTHAVILATDTDPSDLDRPEIREKLKKGYAQSPQSEKVPFEKMLVQLRASLYSPSHVVNRDVADWVSDYPDILVGFGSVNLSKSSEYVEEKLEEIRRLKLRGIKLLPYSQFFNPSENENMDLLFQYCEDTQSIILSHCGCGAGPFEIPELSRDSHPDLWEPLLKKYPSVPLVLAHFGAYSTYIPGIWLHEVLQLGKKYRNVYADLAAVDWLMDREMVVKEIRKTIGFDRVLFATDYPLSKTAGVNLAYLTGSLKANTFLTEKEKRKVLGLNGSRLLGLT
ncbi:MAG: amidohydrolase family protein [Syntrophobacteraceae bacterium]|nr:amidohydrolase family protein [Syntrophobacteraceae bacterium]